jgi:hypothetical protein
MKENSRKQLESWGCKTECSTIRDTDHQQLNRGKMTLVMATMA